VIRELLRTGACPTVSNQVRTVVSSPYMAMCTWYWYDFGRSPNQPTQKWQFLLRLLVLLLSAARGELGPLLHMAQPLVRDACVVSPRNGSAIQ
jgi:hypothetical protein